MKCYSAREFMALVEDASFIYGHVSLNASLNIPTRIKKKSLLASLRRSTKNGSSDASQIYCNVDVDSDGRTIIRLV